MLFAAGDLDPTFSGDGVAQIGNTFAGRAATDVVALPGGKTFVTGITEGGPGSYRHVAYLARYNPNGTLDTTFSGDGRHTFDFGTGDDAEGRFLLVRPDGKIFVVGLAGDGSRTGRFILGVALLNANGTFDTTFGGGDGRVLVDVPDSDGDFIQGVALAPGNKIVGAVTEFGRGGFLAMRLNANGTPDTSFGGTGFVSLNPGPMEEHAHSVAVAPDGGVIVGGMRYLTGPDEFNNREYETALVKLRSDGHVDMTWGGGDGQVHGTFANDAFLDLAAAPGGKLVGAGNSGIARFNPDGSPDRSFNTDGKVPRGTATFRDIAVGADGKVYDLGQSARNATGQDSSFVIARLKADGFLDSTWDGDGTAVTNFLPGRDDPAAVALHADGKVSVAGETDPVETDFSLMTIVVAKYTSTGRLDTTFSGDGRTGADFGSVLREGAATAVQADGRVLVGGSETRANSSSRTGFGTDFFLARFTAGGSPDTSFSSDGRVTTDFGGGTEGIADVLVQPDGKILVLGQTRAVGRSDSDLALARYNANGTLDTTFSGDGKMVLGLGGNDAGAKLARRSDGDIVLSARTAGNSRGNSALVHLNPNGTLDTSFNGTGILYQNFGTAFALQADNKILLAGDGYSAAYPDGGVFLTRLNVNGTTDTAYGEGGRTAHYTFGNPEDDWVEAVGVTIQGGKALLLAEATFQHNARKGPALFRFNADGTIDSTFGGGDGKAAYEPSDEFTYWETPHAVALDPSGRVLIGATTRTYVEGDGVDQLHQVVYRLTSDGEPDAAFGTAGRRRIDAFVGDLRDLAVAPDGRPVVAGTYYIGDYEAGGIVAARLQAGGTSGGGGGGSGVELVGGELRVTGTAGNDTATVDLSGSEYVVTFNGATRRFASSSVTGIRLDGLGGADTLSVNTTVTLGATIIGGDGNDVLWGGSGPDTLDGGAGADQLRSRTGDDTLRGGIGNDLLTPGGGADRAFGDDGDDQFYARDNTAEAVLDGGAGTDRAQLDDNDPRTSIETLLA